MGRRAAIVSAVAIGGALFLALRLSKGHFAEGAAGGTWPVEHEISAAPSAPMGANHDGTVAAADPTAQPSPAEVSELGSRWSPHHVVLLVVLVACVGAALSKYAVPRIRKRRRTSPVVREAKPVGPKDDDSALSTPSDDKISCVTCTAASPGSSAANTMSVRETIMMGDLSAASDVGSRADSPASSTTSSVRRVLRALPSDNDGWNVLHIAASTNAIETLRRFLRNMAFRGKVNAVDRRLRTPAHVAAEHGHHLALELLMDCGADVTMKDGLGRSVVEVSISQWPCLRVVLSRSPTAPIVAELGRWRDAETQRSLLALACCSAEAEDITQLLISLLPELVGHVDLQGRTPLHYAAEYGLSGTVHMLVEMSGGLLAARDTRGALPAHMAAHSGVLSVAECVLEATAGSVGPIATLKDGSGSTPLDYAARAQRESPSAEQAAIVALLEKYGCPP